MTELNKDEPLDPRSEFVHWSKEKKRLAAEEKKASAECERLEPIVRGLMEKDEEQKFTRSGITVYLRRIFGVGRHDDDTTEDEFCAALKEAGGDWEDFVKDGANKRSLASHVTGLYDALDDPLAELELPDCFDGIVKITDGYKAVATKAAKK